MRDLNFESAIDRLDEIVHALESGDQTLEKSLKLFEEGTRLAVFCGDTLQKAEQKITALTCGEALHSEEEEARGDD